MVEERHALIKGKVERRANGRRMVNGNETANGVFRAFRALWNFAADRAEDLGRDPGRLKNQWDPVKARTDMVPAGRPADWSHAVLALPNQMVRDCLLLLLFTGMRRCEATEMRWEEVDFGLGVIRIPAERTKSKRPLALPMT